VQSLGARSYVDPAVHRLAARRIRAVLRCGEAPVDVEANKDVMRRIFDRVINGRHLEEADALYSDEHELHPDAGIGRGGEGMRQAFAGLHEQFPDVRVTIEEMVAEGDTVAVRLTYTGTDASTGERATWPEMVFTRFADGRAIESWEILDTGRGPDLPPW
jgi:predicted SnoaL-like aldol condensation-catalyzing enzyme